jgi:hypothetical protein
VWRIVFAALAIAVVVLSGALYRATRDAPTHAAESYYQWAVQLYEQGSANPEVWKRAATIAQVPYAANKEADGVITGLELTHNPNQDYQRLMTYLMSIGHDLDIMYTSALSDRKQKDLRADGKYIRQVVRRDILQPLGGATPSGGPRVPALPGTDTQALAMTHRLCEIAATVKLRSYARFYAGGIPAGTRADLQSACAHGYTFP